MFGKLFSRQTAIMVVLLGFCMYIIKLFADGKINLYIHPRYSLFAVVMSCIAVAVLVAGFVVYLIKNRVRNGHHHQGVTSVTKGIVVNSIVVLILVLVFILPAKALSTEAIGQRILKTPTSNSDTSLQNTSYNRLDSDQTCPDSVLLTIDAWVSELSSYPLHCNEGRSITLTGFVFESPASPLPSDMYYLGRVVMSCCAIDAQPYALPVKKDDRDYPKDSWWKVDGILVQANVNGVEQLVVEPHTVTGVAAPNNPYEYINALRNKY